MIGAGLLYITDSTLFYEYLFGSSSSTTLIESSRSTVNTIIDTIFGNSILNKILFFAFWMVVGLVVYIIINGLGAGVSSAEATLEETQYVHAQRLKMSSEFAAKLILRLIALGLLVIFGVVFFKFLLPFAVLNARIVAGNAGQASNWIYGLLGFVVLCASFYIATVLIRFLLLKPRIFGGTEDMLEAELKHQ
jgi:hypothetical protein